MGKVSMVDVGGKEVVHREATAEGFIKLRPETVERIREGSVEKGDIFSVATTAAILAVKKVPELIPLTHNIPITHVDVSFEVLDEGVKASVTVKTDARTGVEMEALAGVSAALLNVWDMVKKYEKDESGQYPHTEIRYVRVVKKVKTSLNP
ncbi:MAG: cyclic pyranopterin monophosphate synthase MoaC [Desulfurococcales archaeon]|nr:cyclic pyranopterin monophosphate synthase MoaC [Desulfurococcales archaeon]